MNNIINNYKMVKVTNKFIDGEVEAVEFYMCGYVNWNYLAEIKNNKVTLFKKTFDGGSKKVDIPDFKRAALEYFNSNDFEVYNDYTD